MMPPSRTEATRSVGDASAPVRRLAILGTRGIPARYGGFETFAEELAVGLANDGFSVTVFCETADDNRGDTTYKGVRLVRVPVVRLGPLTTIVFDVRCLWRARRGFDVCYMLGYGAALFLLLPRLFGTPVWVNMDGIEWRRSKWSLAGQSYLRLMERIAVWTSSLVIADAEAIRMHLQSRNPRLRRCVVIPYGAHEVGGADPAEIANRFGVEPGEYYLVVCRLEPENHVREIVSGFAASRSSRPLLIVGDHRVQTKYARALQNFSSDRIRFLGAIYDPPLLAALRTHSRAYLHGHSVGGTNPSLLEAMGAGNIVIAHDNPFNREVLADCGLYFRDADELPALIGMVEEMTAEQRAWHGQVVRGRVRDRYSWRSIVGQYAELLQRT